ncbi:MULTISPECIES: hypothetical protein [Streptomyces]|uniref:hypothetical protein n=1 Tax=Streptomyces TaxID=1883 RepID=UPI0016770075|nr:MULTISPECIES: hypothetical protein [Streptomyces]MBD3577191.1 hypothetical protein [Streptomyces sp. KD18]GGS86698.1 hypothetical protein GCM10010286_09210 [Streptomyces toxytricini]
MSGQVAEKAPDPAAEGQADGGGTADSEQPAQEPWAARRDLDAHAPKFDFRGVNRGVAAQHVIGDIITGGKVEHHYTFGGFRNEPVAGEIPAETLERLAEDFVPEGTVFEELLERLRHERVIVLMGNPFSGRRTAALMLLHRLGALPVRALDRDVPPSELSLRLASGDGAVGHVLLDLEISREQPLREAHLLALRGRMRERGAYLVITTEVSPYVESTVALATWRPPEPAAVLAALLPKRTGADRARELLVLPAVAEFLSRERQIREVVRYVAVLAEEDRERIEQYSLRALEQQVQEWFEEAETPVQLREKAFLIALAAFDKGPYALTAELSDTLYKALRSTGDDTYQKPIPVFGTHIGKRLQKARAHRYPADETTEWGPVTQVKAAFHDERVAPMVLREVWTGHPAARPALIKWLNGLAVDGRPFVRTRAAAAVAVLALTDLPSAMALIVEPWAGAKESRRQLTAVSTLALAHRIGAPNIPRIVDVWSTSVQDPKRCWVGVRALGLIGPERPAEALDALRAQARHQYDKKQAQGRVGAGDEQVADELPQSVALLLLSEATDAAVTTLLPQLGGHPSAQALALDGFLTACERQDADWCPPMLDTTARSAVASSAVSRFLRAALNDRRTNERAEDVLRQWLRAADRNPATERALSELLPLLVAGQRDAARLVHLLDTLQGPDGGPRPAVAERMHTALTRPLAHT